MVALRAVIFLVPVLLARARIAEESFSDDGVSLLQMSSRHRSAHAETPDVSIHPTLEPTASEVVLSPLSDAVRLIGRYDVATLGDTEDVVRFDAAGFEVQFHVQGATEIRAVMYQEITGPLGWWGNPNPTPEEEYFDGCLDQKNALGVFQQTGSAEKIDIGMFENLGSEPHHFLVYVDGIPQYEHLTKSRCQICTFDTHEAIPGTFMDYWIARGLDKSKSHHIRIVKTSEPDFLHPWAVPNWLGLQSLVMDQGFAHDIEPAPPRQRKIEFIGDSMMSGYCNTCDGTLCTTGRNKGNNLGGNAPGTFRWGNFALAWPHLLCEDLNAECHATVLSGMGTYCNTHPDGPFDCSHDQTLPNYWTRTLASDPDSKWDFSTWTPDVLIIQASSNDHLFDPSRDPKAVLISYERLLDTIHATHPNVHVFITCQSDSICLHIENLVHKKKSKGEEIDMILMNDFDENTHFKSCCGHPDAAFHKVMKDRVVEEVTRVLG